MLYHTLTRLPSLYRDVRGSVSLVTNFVKELLPMLEAEGGGYAKEKETLAEWLEKLEDLSKEELNRAIKDKKAEKIGGHLVFGFDSPREWSSVR